MKFDPEISYILDTISSELSQEKSREYSFLNAISYYKQRKFFEAHEIFEFQWKKEEGAMKLFIQALIQVSVAMNKIHVKPNLIGAKSQLEKAMEKIDKLLHEGKFKQDSIHLVHAFFNDLKEIHSLIENKELLLEFPIPEINEEFRNYII